jgi:hypothetical protein
VTLRWDGGKGGSLSDENITSRLGWRFGTELLLRKNRNQDIPQLLT